MSKSIMIQGTMSNAGKSLITAGLCRIFKQDGYKVAPFKSQNMALNSFITNEGLEMGRAQVVQCEAAKIEPSVKMNPILLKPTNDIGSQVIVNGKAIGVMSAVEYFEYKKKLVPFIMEAYNELSKEYDIIVIEGAGSPAEINLKSYDIVNMGLAKMVNSPVLLAGDIDRGGVFASLYGTVELLEEDEKNFIKGIIINKFRGDKSILKPGLDMLENLIKKKIIGVIPYMNIDIEDEDSLSERFDNKKVGIIDIAIIKFPHISNFTDFNALEQIDGVSVRYIKNVNEFKNPDLIILPGTKNTISDLLFIRQNGIESYIKKNCSHIPIIGICGGYQMLGKVIDDFKNIEKGGKINGIGLIDINTIFEEEKICKRVKGKVLKNEGFFSELSEIEFNGYEIHMGYTEVREKYFCNINSSKEFDGVIKNNIFGCYIHGIFDNKNFTQKLIEIIAKSKGIELSNLKAVNWYEYKEKEYNKLADIIRENVDINHIYKVIEEGV